MSIAIIVNADPRNHSAAAKILPVVGEVPTFEQVQEKYSGLYLAVDEVKRGMAAYVQATPPPLPIGYTFEETIPARSWGKRPETVKKFVVVDWGLVTNVYTGKVSVVVHVRALTKAGVYNASSGVEQWSVEGIQKWPATGVVSLDECRPKERS